MKSKLRGVKHRIEEPTPSCSDNSFTGLPPQMSADQRTDAEQQARNLPGRFRGTCSLSTWLTKVAINSALMVVAEEASVLRDVIRQNCPTDLGPWNRGNSVISRRVPNVSAPAENRSVAARRNTFGCRGATRLLLRCITQKSAQQRK